MATQEQRDRNNPIGEVRSVNRENSRQTGGFSMNPSDFDTTMDILGYTSTLGRAVALRVAERTVEGYQEGREIPGPVRKLISVMCENEDLRRENAWLKKRLAS